MLFCPKTGGKPEAPGGGTGATQGLRTYSSSKRGFSISE